MSCEVRKQGNAHLGGQGLRNPLGAGSGAGNWPDPLDNIRPGRNARSNPVQQVLELTRFGARQDPQLAMVAARKKRIAVLQNLIPRSAATRRGTKEYAERQLKQDLGDAWTRTPYASIPVYRFLESKKRAGEPVTDGEIRALSDAIQRNDFRHINSRIASYVTSRHIRDGGDPALALGLNYRFLDIVSALHNGDKVVPQVEEQNGISTPIPIRTALSRIEGKTGRPFSEFLRANMPNLEGQVKAERQLALHNQLDREYEEGKDADFLSHVSYLQFIGKQLKDALPNASKWLVDYVAEYAASKYGLDYGVTAEQILADPEMQEAMRTATARTNMLANTALSFVKPLQAAMFAINTLAPVTEAAGATLSTGRARDEGFAAGRDFLKSYDVTQGGTEGLLAALNLLGTLAMWAQCSRGFTRRHRRIERLHGGNVRLRRRIFRHFARLGITRGSRFGCIWTGMIWGGSLRRLRKGSSIGHRRRGK
jgi:hypothetical protein